MNDKWHGRLSNKDKWRVITYGGEVLESTKIVLLLKASIAKVDMIHCY